ncbi:hypothetical protein P167DRAFT_494723 [Morchella conica CCBAS932]|uniref:DUF1349-domain-containing protein n=1 Tax=Morchella conica CCBAS932 TaxID=1392247 RepID=A0A3N4KFC8_9PEZI|nr:hypothetical protein P167DRAFT_494723 [Morchella conica CCBAS932]
MTPSVPISDFTLHAGTSQTPVWTQSIPFTLTATAVTDLWRKPGHIAHEINSITTSMPLSSFARATATFRTEAFHTLYDQAGLVFLFPPREDGHPERWVKAGVEVVGGVPRVSVVAADKASWADWSLAGGDEGVKKDTMTLEMVREGPSLVMNMVGKGEERSAVREVAWVFEGGLVSEGPEISVGVYVAKPTKDEGSPILEVCFEAMKVWKIGPDGEEIV